MEINGYKAFNQDLTNRYGFKFEEGKTYSVDDYPSFGLNGKGFHFCKNIEDTFRYFNPDNCLIASVTGMGEIAEGFDDYNEYYNMFSSNKIRINHVLSREEVLSEILSLNTESRVCRFIAVVIRNLPITPAVVYGRQVVKAILLIVNCKTRIILPKSVRCLRFILNDMTLCGMW